VRAAPRRRGHSPTRGGLDTRVYRADRLDRPGRPRLQGHRRPLRSRAECVRESRRPLHRHLVDARHARHCCNGRGTRRRNAGGRAAVGRRARKQPHDHPPCVHPGRDAEPGETLRGSAWSKTGPRIRSRTSTSPLSPSAKRRRRTPWLGEEARSDPPHGGEPLLAEGWITCARAIRRCVSGRAISGGHNARGGGQHNHRPLAFGLVRGALGIRLHPRPLHDPRARLSAPAGQSH
jgi:hypothetical protein